MTSGTTTAPTCSSRCVTFGGKEGTWSVPTSFYGTSRGSLQPCQAQSVSPIPVQSAHDGSSSTDAHVECSFGRTRTKNCAAEPLPPGHIRSPRPSIKASQPYVPPLNFKALIFWNLCRWWCRQIQWDSNCWLGCTHSHTRTPHFVRPGGRGQTWSCILWCRGSDQHLC